jgi:hypothetical protein
VIARKDVFSLRVVAETGIASAAIAPTNAPKMAKTTFWFVYENAIPAMLIAWREPAAKASCVAKSDRTKLGTTIPAMNKAITTSISNRRREKVFCLFMLFPFPAFNSVAVVIVQEFIFFLLGHPWAPYYHD